MQTSLHAFQLEPHIAVTSQLLTPHNVPCVPNSSTFNQKPVVPHSLSRSSATVENSLPLTEAQPTGSLFHLSQFSFQSNQACCLSYRYFRLHYVSTSIYRSTSYGAFELWTEHCSQTTDVVEGVWTAQQHQNYCLLMTSSLGHCPFQYNFCVCFHQSVCLSVCLSHRGRN